MSEHPLVLHHYDFSNYSEKIRLVMGLKDLAWRSVTIPSYAPKPDYTPLTGGYRRTPALQIGADVYCDTRLIAQTLDALAPDPPLSAGTDRASAEARCDVLVHWAETALMRPVALYITGVHAARFDPRFHADRARLHGRATTPDVARVQASAERYRAQVYALLPTLEALLPRTGFVLGSKPSLADFALYEAPWFLRTIGGDDALPGELPRTLAWMDRVAAVGHGRSLALSAANALAIARDAEPRPLPGPSGMAAHVSPADASAPAAASPTHRVRPDTGTAIEPGAAVTVSPLDQRSPASGRLVHADGTRIVIATDHPRTGRVHVHFPRVGYRIDPARTPTSNP